MRPLGIHCILQSVFYSGLFLCLSLAASPLVAAQEPNEALQRRLVELFGIGNAEELVAREPECLTLLDVFKAPEDKGLIYARLSSVFSNASNASHDLDQKRALRGKAIQYYQTAVQYPQDTKSLSILYMRWGELLHQDLHGKNVGELCQERPPVLRCYLKSLAITLQEVGDSPKQPRPSVAVTQEDIQSKPDNLSARDLRLQKLSDRDKVDLENEFRYRRDVLKGKIVRLYGEYGQRPEEILELGREIVSDETILAELVEKARAAAVRFHER